MTQPFYIRVRIKYWPFKSSGFSLLAFLFLFLFKYWTNFVDVGVGVSVCMGRMNTLPSPLIDKNWTSPIRKTSLFLREILIGQSIIYSIIVVLHLPGTGKIWYRSFWISCCFSWVQINQSLIFHISLNILANFWENIQQALCQYLEL